MNMPNKCFFVEKKEKNVFVLLLSSVCMVDPCDKF